MLDEDCTSVVRAVRKNFRTAPHINYACVLLSSKTTTYSQVYWIYTLLIDTYFINKNGFRCVRLFFLSPRSVFPLSFPFLFIRLPVSVYPGPSHLFFFLTFYPSASLELPPFILPLDYLSICSTTTPRWFVEVCPVINYFYVSLAMNMIKTLRNLHLNDVLKRHLTFLTFCMKKCFILSTDWFSD